MSDQISRRHFLKNIALGTGAAAMGSTRAWANSMNKNSGNSPKPNFVLFLSDDHAKMDAGCYGNDVIQTPGIDRLASEGMRFDEAYCITATCSPSRASFFTGLSPQRHGAFKNHGMTNPGIKTLPHYLSNLGYRVLLAGKSDVRPHDAYSFEYLDQKGDWTTTIVKEGSEVEAFLKNEAKNNQPFCLVISTHNPHVPWPESDRYKPEDVLLHPYHLDTGETRKAMANYYNDASRMDAELDRTLDLLDKHGLADQTVCIYTSDQGPQFPHGKWELYDYGINIPYIVRWPEQVKAGSVSNAMISSVDTLATMIDLAGGTPPADINGISFSEVLTGENSVHRDRIYSAHTRDGMMNYFPIRAVRNSRYKYIWNLAPERAYTTHVTNSNQFRERGGESLWDSWLSLANSDMEARERVRMLQHRPEIELYDIQKDPAELNNLADDPNLQKIKQEMEHQLKVWMKQQGDKGRGQWDKTWDQWNA